MPEKTNRVLTTACIVAADIMVSSRYTWMALLLQIPYNVISGWIAVMYNLWMMILLCDVYKKQ